MSTDAILLTISAIVVFLIQIDLLFEYRKIRKIKKEILENNAQVKSKLNETINFFQNIKKDSK